MNRSLDQHSSLDQHLSSDQHRRRVRTSRRPRRGFSLVELTITLLILGILGAVASPRFAELLNHYRVDAAAAQIAADLNFVRRTAINTSVSRTLKFHLEAAGNHHYHATGSDPVSDPHHPDSDLHVFLDQAAPGVTLRSVSFDASDTITFNQYGLPLAGSPPSAMTAGAIVVAAGSEQRTIQISPATGKAEVL